MIKASPHNGYRLKEAPIEKKQLSYVDDHTVISDSPDNAQSLLNVFNEYLKWTSCVKAKPTKCRSLAFKVFRKRENSKYKPLMEVGYSALDPKLEISGQPIPFLGEESFKFLGRKISLKGSAVESKETRDNLISDMEMIDKVSITGTMKMWLYNHFVITFITWSGSFLAIHRSMM